MLRLAPEHFDFDEQRAKVRTLQRVHCGVRLLQMLCQSTQADFLRALPVRVVVCTQF